MCDFVCHEMLFKFHEKNSTGYNKCIYYDISKWKKSYLNPRQLLKSTEKPKIFGPRLAMKLMELEEFFYMDLLNNSRGPVIIHLKELST